MSLPQRLLVLLLLLTTSTGCIATGAKDGSTSMTLNLNWLIGGIAMAVDGDDRDDHVGWFEDDDCDCDCD